MADNVFSELSRMIDQVGKDKGIDKKVIIEAIEMALETAARKKFGANKEIEAQYNEETGDIKIYEFKNVVEEIDLEDTDILLDDARKLDPDVQIGDSLGIELDGSQLGRIAAQTAKQIIMGRVRDAERDIIYSEFQERKGDIASGIARRLERGAIVVDLGRTEAYLPQREQIPGEIFKPGDRIQGYIADVRQTNRGPQIIMSRADERYLMKLFEMEVPEVYDGIVEIKAAAREPGSRAKIAVTSKDPSVDPVGACVGMKGSRVQNIVQELKGEKIDIVQWNEDPSRFVCNALAPAEVSKVIMDENSKEMEIVVPDNQLSLAIGKKGQNVRLAAKLSGWKLDILSETKVQAKTQEAIFNLMLIPGISETMAQNIYQSGFGSLQEIAKSTIEDLAEIPGYDGEKAQKLKDTVNELIKQYEASGKALPTAGEGEVRAVSGAVDAKSLAEARLRMELNALKTQNQNSENTEDAKSADEQELLKVRGVGETTVEQLKSAGIFTVQQLAEAEIDKLTAIEGIGEAKAQQLKADASAHVQGSAN
ncbi:MAG: transcription termination/antitermination protein NusA [Oligoflexia bacterium]|nr:transcription termination/antitermination protein NusA [Oligoflexia bacterium]